MVDSPSQAAVPTSVVTATPCYNSFNRKRPHPNRAGERRMTTVSNKLMTAEELLMLPKGDGRRFELIRGVLVEKMPDRRPPR